MSLGFRGARIPELDLVPSRKFLIGMKKGTQLQPHRMTGIMLRLSVEQADALTRSAAAQGIGRGELIRRLITTATGVEDTVMQKRPRARSEEAGP
jgi:hypothetical protein